MAYPSHGDPRFVEKLLQRREFSHFRVKSPGVFRNEREFEANTKQVCSDFDKLHQHLYEQYLSFRSPYRSLLLYHSLGVGKTCSAITIAEAMLVGHTATEGPRILVISSTALQRSFEDQIKGECTDGVYQRLTNNDPKRLAALVKSRYEFITYDGIKQYSKLHKSIRNKTIIIDEAHNFRDETTKKESAIDLEKMIRRNAGKGNRLVLLSATPMYDKPKEIFWLLGLLVSNDGIPMPKKTETFDDNANLTPAAEAILQRLSGEYISYIKSRNPFAFAQRLSPSQSGIRTYAAPWAAPLTDGLVTTRAGDLQAGVVNSQSYQAANIVFANNKEGDDGFKSMFSRNGNPDVMTLVYNQGHEGALMPTANKLGRIAAKMLRICDLLRESNGIVLVYSRYIYSGVVPMAVALEHMGYQRYGQASILARNQAELVRDPVKPGLKYCILSGDKDVMGTSTIASCMKDINAANNINGDKIKVVLITQVAGEGLSLRNIREVHIMEPWFHMNRIDQVVGRAIRTCSHVDLPLAKRNVTVFLHALESESGADLSVYRDFVVTKIKQIEQVQRVIQESAFDCDLMKNMNYYDAANFPFKVKMESSRSSTVDVQFGDPPSVAPKCRAIAPPLKPTSSHTYDDAETTLIPLAVKRIVKGLARTKVTGFIPYIDIVAMVGLSEAIVKSALPRVLYPNTVIPGKLIHRHMNGIVIGDLTKDTRTFTKVILPHIVTNETNVSITDLLKHIRHDDPAVVAFMMYTLVYESIWDEFARHIIDNVPEIAQVMKKHGTFVWSREVGIGGRDVPVGYVNIFDIKTFAVTIKGSAKDYRRATDDEQHLILEGRKAAWSPNTVTSNKELIGMFVPEKKMNKFKLLTTATAVGKKTGKVCTSFAQGELVKILNTLLSGRKVDPKQPKDQMCISTGIELMRANRILMYPIHKPDSKSI